MKYSEAVEEVRRTKPNAYSDADFMRWINQVESQVQEVLGIKPDDMVMHKWKDNGDTELLMPRPYDVCYIWWLKAMVDYNNEEHASYANNQEQFESNFYEYRKYIRRTVPDTSNMNITNYF